MVDIEIKRGYEVLPDNNVRFGVRVINNSDSAISDVEVLLDYSESLFELNGNKVQKLGNIPPTVPRTVKFILKPLGCIHKEEIGATILYKDHQWKKHTVEMRPKEVHCVCPFLKEKSITRADFLRLSNSGYLEERGVNFDGITVDKLVDFIGHTCKNRLYKVDEFPIENGKILYLAGDALGEKAYYLLTAVAKEYEGLTQVLLRASSDKSYGLNGFLNEILDNLRHLVVSANAKEIGVIKKEQVINIIDSVVQRSTISMEEGAPSIKIKDSMVQRTEIKGDEMRKTDAREELERKSREEAERTERKTATSENSTRKSGGIAGNGELIASKEPERASWKGFFVVALLLGVVLIGYWTMAPYSKNAPETVKSTLSATPIPILTPTVVATTVQISTNIIVDQVLGNRSNSSSTTLDNGLQIRIKPDVGRTSIDLRQLIITVWDQDYHYDLNYSSTGIANLTFTASAVRDEDRSFSAATPVLNSGDLVTLYVTQANMPGISLTTRKTFWLSLNQELGSQVNLELTTPNSFGIYKFVQLYP